MYTESIEKEMEFLIALSNSSSENMKNGECVSVRECPKCNNGMVITNCVHQANKIFRHYCDTCKEEFNISKIKSEVFFNKQDWMLKAINTSFGDISIKVNDKPGYFKYSVKIYEGDKKPFAINIIDFEISKLKIDDVITVGFDNSKLKYNGNDDNLVVYTCENRKSILGICAYIPCEEKDCYELVEVNKNGFKYKITKEPKGKMSFKVACIDKKDYIKPNVEIFLGLVDTI